MQSSGESFSRSTTLTLSDGKKFVLLFLVSLFLHLWIARLPDTMGDILVYRRWLQVLMEHGLYAAYSENPAFYPDGLPTPIQYPPIFAYLLTILGKLCLFINPEVLRDSKVVDFLIRLPSIAGDLATGCLLYFVSKRDNPRIGVMAFGSYALNPAVLFNTSYWGQTDSLIAFMLLLSVILAGQRKMKWSWICLTIGILIKPAFLIAFIPLLIVWNHKHDPKELFSSLGAVLLTLVLVFLPFLVNNHFREILRLLYLRIDMMAYVSVNAHNLWWAITGGLPWTLANEKILWGLSYQNVAIMLFSSVYGVVIYKFWGAQDKKSLYMAASIIALCLFMLSTHMHENHLFLFLPLFALVCFSQTGYIGIFMFFSFTFLLNMILHDPYFYHLINSLRFGDPFILQTDPNVSPAVLDLYEREGYKLVIEQSYGKCHSGWFIFTILNSWMNVLMFFSFLYLTLRSKVFLKKNDMARP